MGRITVERKSQDQVERRSSAKLKTMNVYLTSALQLRRTKKGGCDGKPH
jgi:hypothetical protein